MKPELLKELVKLKMPYGKFEGRLIADLPVSYLEWFARKGFPTGKLGMLMQTALVIKRNGLEELLIPLREK